MPGRKENNGANREAREAFKYSFLEGREDLIEDIFCSLMLFPVLIESTIAEVPNNPVSKGKRGSFIGRLKVISPRRPDRENTKKERRKLFSLKIRYREIKIKMNGIANLIDSYKDGRKKMNKGVKIRMIGKAVREPTSDNKTALNPWP